MFLEFGGLYLVNIRFILPKSNHKSKITDILLNGYRKLKSVFIQLKNLSRLRRFLSPFFLVWPYRRFCWDLFGEEEIGADSNQKTVGLIVSILLIQIVAIFGAILTARASERFEIL